MATAPELSMWIVLTAGSLWVAACSSSGETGAGGAVGTTGSGGAAGASGGSAGTSAGGATGVNLDQLGSACSGGQCPSGLTPVTWCGIAGCGSSSQCTCEIVCEPNPAVCPAGSTCANISDGPGNVCVKS